ncbi:MAG: helix-turn-helix transcriptional regulator [Bacteroidetes bacterium]|nr:helix-turn-helix transcriptional regulator [Bacteroidota bacterium]
MKKFEIIVERTNTGFSAYASQYSVATTGQNLTELKNNMIEALNINFEEKGIQISENDLKITLDLAQFFDFYKVINAKALSERIGMNQSLLSQYIKGIKKPSPSQTQRILKGVQQIGRELAEVRFLI